MPANHFPTPSAADGLLLAPSADQVVAFAAAAAPSGRQPFPGPQRGRGGRQSPSAVAVGCLVVIGAAVWLGRRRRT